MHFLRKTMTALCVFSTAVFSTAVLTMAAGAFAPADAAPSPPRPVNPDWPPIPLAEDLFADNPVPAYHSDNPDAQIQDFIQAFYVCLSSCSADEQLSFFRFHGTEKTIILPTVTIRTPEQYRADAERRARDNADLDYFVNTYKATGGSDEPLVHVTVVSSGTHSATGESFRFLTDEQLQLIWDDDAGSYKITHYQINTMAPA